MSEKEKPLHIAAMEGFVSLAMFAYVAAAFSPAAVPMMIKFLGMAMFTAGSGGIYLTWHKNSFAGRLQELFENVGLAAKKNGKMVKPRIIKNIKTPYGNHIILYLPPGLCKSDFEQRKEEMEYYLNAEIEFEVKKHLHMMVMNHALPTSIPFDLPDDWEEQTKGMALPVPIGHSRAGLEFADLADFPHLLVAGETYGGKSNFLHQMVATLLPRKNVELFVIDLAKVEFAYLRDRAKFASTLKQALKILDTLTKEMHRRMDVLTLAGVVKIQDYEGDDMPYMVLVVDELSQLSPVLAKANKDTKAEREKAHGMLVDLLCLARKVGIHVVVSTQRPDRDILPGQLKANIPATVCFKVRNRVNSEICLDNDRADKLPRIKGRAIYQFDKEREVQVMYLPVSQARNVAQGK